jgi:hypothetical protein
MQTGFKSAVATLLRSVVNIVLLCTKFLVFNTMQERSSFKAQEQQTGLQGIIIKVSPDSQHSADRKRKERNFKQQL